MFAQVDIEPLRTFCSAVVFVVGSMVGSFLNVCVYRLPRNESVVRPRSRCPKCGHLIAWYDNVPMISWLLLRARCRHCAEPISGVYPLVEGLTGVLFLLVFLRFGFTLASPVYMLLVAALVLVTFVDLADWTIPNEVTYPGIPLGVALAVVAMGYPDSGLVLDNVFAAVRGVLLGGGLLYLLDVGSLAVLGKRGMGFGDVKLLAMLGAFLGAWPNMIVTIALAACLGTVVGLAVIGFDRRKRGGPADAKAGPKPVRQWPSVTSVAAMLAVAILFVGTYAVESHYDGQFRLVLLKNPGTALGHARLLALWATVFSGQGVVVMALLAAVVGFVALFLKRVAASQGKEGHGEGAADQDADEDVETMDGHYLPFGPFLAVAGLIVLFVGPALVEAYMNFLRPGTQLMNLPL